MGALFESCLPNGLIGCADSRTDRCFCPNSAADWDQVRGPIVAPNLQFRELWQWHADEDRVHAADLRNREWWLTCQRPLFQVEPSSAVERPVIRHPRDMPPSANHPKATWLPWQERYVCLALENVAGEYQPFNRSEIGMESSYRANWRARRGSNGRFCASPDPCLSTFPTGWLLRLCKSDAMGHTPCDAPVSILIVGLSVRRPDQMRSSTCGWDQSTVGTHSTTPVRRKGPRAAWMAKTTRTGTCAKGLT